MRSSILFETSKLGFQYSKFYTNTNEGMQTMMLNDRIETLPALRAALRKAEKHISSLPGDTPYSEFHYRQV